MNSRQNLVASAATRTKHLAIDLASWTIALVCESYPLINERREIHLLRMQLNGYQHRVSELEVERDQLKEQVANYRAMHELQHGPTSDLPLTVESLIDKHSLN